jgi:2-keto-4-pentenoate hydratase
MNQTQISKAVDEILGACRAGRLIDAMSVGAPSSLADAYAVQDKLFRSDGAGAAAGWFAAATNRSMLKQLGLEEPYAARWRPGRFLPSPARVTAPGELSIALEAEVTFLLKKDLPARAAAYSASEVAEAIQSVHPSIEIVISCFADWMNQDPLNMIAEGGFAQHLVYGAGIADWRDIDLAALPVSIVVDGVVKSEGRSANVLDGPLSVLEWLARHASSRGDGLRAGQMCNTGMCSPVYFARRGDRAVAQFGRLGSVEVEVA